MLDEAAPEFQALLASVRDRGVDYPIILDESGRVVDGRNRVRACIRAGIEAPAVRRADAEAAEIILSALVNRRHLPKSALAYLCIPFFAPALISGRDRRLANLKIGDSSRNPIQSGSGIVGKTIIQLAAEMGFSPDLYEQAVKVRKLFTDEKPRTWHDGPREVTATYREWFEPKILTGEIGLGGVIQAIAGKASTEGKALERRDLPTLLRRGFSDLNTRFARWDSLAPETRRELTAELATAATEWPEDVRQRLLSALEKAAAHRPAKTAF